MVWVWFATGVLVALLCLYWRNRALEAERRARANLEDMFSWQKRATEWSKETIEWREFFEELEAEVDDDAEDAPPAEYAGTAPKIVNAAQMFNFASEAFYYRWLEWDPRHD